MALTQNDRISISKRLIAIDGEKANATNSKASLQVEQQKALDLDNINKGIMTPLNDLITQYQAELSQYDGNGRLPITEQHLIDSAQKKRGNYFFPNDTQTPTPSLPDGVWKNFVPFAKSLVVGKNYQEAYNPVANGGEITLISNALSTIASIEAKSPQTRSTGDSCTPGSGGGGGGGGGGTGDVIAPDASMQTLATNLINTINTLLSVVNVTKTVIPTLYETPTMQAENTQSTTEANTAISEMNTWLAYPDFDTIAATTCNVFDNYNVNTLGPSKFRASELNPLKAMLQNRQNFINNTRVPQLTGYLGDVVTDSKGHIVSESGWYGRRFRIIDMRINAVGGSLTKYESLKQGINSQDESVLALDNQQNIYGSLLMVSLLKAPGSGNGTIHVANSSIFSISDTVYVVADGKPELTGTIVNIINNTIYLSFDVPKSYTLENFARIYKVI